MVLALGNTKKTFNLIERPLEIHIDRSTLKFDNIQYLLISYSIFLGATAALNSELKLFMSTIITLKTHISITVQKIFTLHSFFIYRLKKSTKEI